MNLKRIDLWFFALALLAFFMGMYWLGSENDEGMLLWIPMDRDCLWTITHMEQFLFAPPTNAMIMI